MKPHLALLFCALAAFWSDAQASGHTTFVKALPKLSQREYERLGVKEVGTHDIERSFSFRFANDSHEEIAEIDVCLRILEGTRTTFLSKPVALTNFQNNGVLNSGSLLPLNTSDWVAPVKFRHANALWNTGSHDAFEIVGCRIYSGPQDLHDIGHLFSWMNFQKAPAIIALFKAHPDLMHVKNSVGVTSFLMAFTGGSAEVVTYMAAHGCSWADHSLSGYTILHFAAIGDLGCCQVALAHVKNVDVKSNHGLTPLMKAVQVGNEPAVDWLLKHKANPNALSSNLTPVAVNAITIGWPRILDMLVKAGANPHFHDANGFGWLHFAAAHNYVMLDKVHSYGIPVDDCIEKTRVTPLMIAARFSQYDNAALWLLRHGANPLIKDKAGATAYDYAKYANTLGTDMFFRKLVEQSKKK